MDTEYTSDRIFVFAHPFVDLGPVSASLCPSYLNAMLGEWVNHPLQPSVSTTQYHLPDVVQAVMGHRCCFAVVHGSLDIVTADDVETFELVEHGDHKQLLVRTKSDKAIMRRHEGFPL